MSDQASNMLHAGLMHTMAASMHHSWSKFCWAQYGRSQSAHLQERNPVMNVIMGWEEKNRGTQYPKSVVGPAPPAPSVDWSVTGCYSVLSCLLWSQSAVYQGL